MLSAAVWFVEFSLREIITIDGGCSFTTWVKPTVATRYCVC